MTSIVDKLGLPHTGFLAFDTDGTEYFVVVAKATFQLKPGAALVLAEEQLPIVFADEHWGEPGVSSVRYESDLAMTKSHVDVLVNGTAYPDKRGCRQFVVRLMTRKIRKELLVTGDRYWSANGVGGFNITGPSAVESMLIRYERAFGGPPPGSPKAPRKVCAENPVGTSFMPARADVDGTALPNIEYPGQPMRAWNHPVRPAGFGYVGRSWHPRIGFAGTYDEAWKRDRFPFLPADFQHWYFQSAPEDQIADSIAPGDTFHLENMHRGGLVSFALPDLQPPLYWRRENQRGEAVAKLDTILIEPDENRLVLTCRATLPAGAKPARLREVILGTLGLGERRAFLGNKRYWNIGEPKE
jgi:hypothetical protein